MNKPNLGNEQADRAKIRIIAVYVILLFITLLSFIGINAYVVSSAADEKRDAFFLQANEAHQHLLQITQSTNYLLDGFSALISGMGLTNYATIVNYTDQVLARVPHIYQIQMAQRVEKDQLSNFNDDQRLFLDYSVRVFDGSTLIDAADYDANVFYPISFVADREMESYSNLGIDVMSFPFLEPYVKLSAIKQMTVLSEPFETLDEEQVFVMVQPAYFAGQEEPDFYTFLLIKSDILIRPGHNMSSYDIKIKANEHLDYFVNRVASDSGHSTWLLPFFEYQKEFVIGAQTLNLNISHQMTWNDIDVTVLVALWVAAILIIISFFFMFRMHFRAELVKLEQSELLYEMANFDSLTHLANRRHFNESLNHAVSQAARRSSRMALMFLDLDGFKQINDTYGHDAGDEALKMAAERIKASVREVDIVGRLGGDEFAVILSDLSSSSDYDITRKRIAESVASITQVGDYNVVLGTSIGVALYPNDAKSAEELLVLADERMYQNKRERKSPTKVTAIHSKASRPNN